MRLTLLSVLTGQTEKGLRYCTSDIRLSAYINTTMNAIPMGDTSRADLWALTLPLSVDVSILLKNAQASS